MKKKGKWLAVILAVAAIIVIGSSVVVTYPNEYKLVKQFGEIVRVIEDPGVSFKIPFIQDTGSSSCMTFRNRMSSPGTKRA